MLFLKFQSVVLLILCGLTLHCGKNDQPSSETPKELYKKDMQHLSSITSVGPSRVDQILGGAFSKVFGGTQSKDIEQFINLRVKHVFNLQDFKTMRLGPVHLEQVWDWRPDDKEDLMIASNVGGALWLETRIAGVEATLIHGQHHIPIDSTRVGVIALSQEYKKSEATQAHGKPVTIHFPPEYRLSTIIHEGRHSDCSGGFSEDKVTAFNNTDSLDEFLKLIGIEQLTCGYLHVNCPAGHDYAGLPACDKVTDGSYAFDALFSLSMYINAPKDSQDEAILEINYLDAISRILQPDNNGILVFQNWFPNMSHSDD